ncbi:hypothetical protein [Mycobacterium ulcerans]|uniref:hypothetical protein n=1 Tax=Mycobacterium ulcerans TaxID=1809 RepID=UPI003F6EDD78
MDSADSLWDMVVSARDVISDFPGDRGWDAGRLLIRIRIRMHWVGRIARWAGSWRMRPALMPGSSGSPRARRWRWIPNSGSC